MKALLTSIPGQESIHGHIVKVFIKILRVMTSNSHENRGQFVTVWLNIFLWDQAYNNVGNHKTEM